jgi:hypothetical protein
MSDPCPDTVPVSVPVADIFRQLSMEIAGVDRQMAALEETMLDEHLKQVLSPQQTKDLQGLDHMRQILACIEDFLTISAENLCETIHLDPSIGAGNLPLKDLSKRLLNPSAAARLVAKTGNVHLF